MASATLVGRSGPGLQVGSVIRRGVSLCGRMVVPFGLLYILAAMPQIVVAASAGVRVPGAPVIGVSLAVATVLAGLISVVTHGAGYVSASRVIDGGPVGVMDAVQAAMRRFFPLLGTWFLAGLLFAVGFILLVVPGVIAVLALLVAGPACVLEGLAPVASLRRSAALTKGQRWRLLALLLAMAVLGALASLVIVPARAIVGPVGGAVVQAMMSALVGLFNVIVATVVFRDLVDGSEGYGSGRMAAVFD